MAERVMKQLGITLASMFAGGDGGGVIKLATNPKACA